MVLISLILLDIIRHLGGKGLNKLRIISFESIRI